MKFVPGKGTKICFWDDVWCGDSALKEEFRACWPHFIGAFMLVS